MACHAVTASTSVLCFPQIFQEGQETGLICGCSCPKTLADQRKRAQKQKARSYSYAIHFGHLSF